MWFTRSARILYRDALIQKGRLDECYYSLHCAHKAWRYLQYHRKTLATKQSKGKDRIQDYVERVNTAM